MIPRSRPAKTEAGRKPTTFARCRSTMGCHGAPSAGPVSWHDWLKVPYGQSDRDFQRDRRNATQRRANSRGTAGWPEACKGLLVEGAPRPLLVVILVLVVIIGESGRVMRRMALVVPELAVDAVGGEQLCMRTALDRLAARDH